MNDVLDLIKQAQAGNINARNKIVIANIGLVYMVLKHINIPGNVFEDAVAEGSLGLFKAIEKFNPKQGCKFSTYATYWVRSYIQNYFYKNRSLLSGLEFDVLSAYDKQYKNLVGDNYDKFLKNHKKFSSIDNALYSVDSLENITVATHIFKTRNSVKFEDVISDGADLYQEFELHDDVSTLIRAINNLPFKLKVFIETRYGLKDGKYKTLRETKTILNKYAKKYFKVSYQYWHVLERQILKTLRTHFPI